MPDRQLCPAEAWPPAAVAHEPTEWLLVGAGAGSTFLGGRYRLVVFDLADIERQLG